MRAVHGMKDSPPQPGLVVVKQADVPRFMENGPPTRWLRRDLLCSIWALSGLTALACAEVFWHWYISDASRPFAHTMLQFYTHVYVGSNKGHASDFPDGFAPTCLMALWLVAVGRKGCSFWWSAVMSLLVSVVLFGLLWVYAGLLPGVPAYYEASSPYMPAIIFPLGVPGAAGMVLRYLTYLVPIASGQGVLHWRLGKRGEK